MKLHELKFPPGSHKKSKRVGRGPGSGLGKTCGRGTKGQNARSGKGPTLGFEGGQMPLKRRLPKRGFINRFKKRFALVNLKDLERFESGAIVDISMMIKEGLIKKIYDGVKVLGKGEITKPLTIITHRISRQAKEKIEKVGGKVEIL